MKYLSAVLTFLLISCNFQTSTKQDKLSQKDFIAITDSISRLMLEHHYNPTELASDEYLLIEQKVKDLAKTARTKQEFIDKFNEIWRDDPFSHVSLGRIERRADEMAEFVDSLHVGEHSVSLDWMEQTAILTVTTMMGVDTKDRVVEAYQEIAGKEAKSLITDLRNNTGGTFAGVPLIGHILTDSIDAGIFVSQKWWKNNSKAPDINDIQGLKSWHGWTLKSFWHDVQQKPLTRVKFRSMQPNFNGQVYVLTSKKTASAAEFTVDAMA